MQTQDGLLAEPVYPRPGGRYRLWEALRGRWRDLADTPQLIAIQAFVSLKPRTRRETAPPSSR